MRDLLTELVRRTLRPELTVQPRLPSRYEPREGARDLAVESDEDDAPRRTSMRGGHRDDVNGQDAGPAQAATPASRHREDMRGTLPEPTTSRDPVVTTPVRATQAAITPNPVTERSPAPGELPRSVMAARARVAEPAATPVPPPHRQVTNELSLTLGRPTLVPAREPASVATAVRAATPREVDGDPAGEPHEPAMPEIRISIGRIDVRAAVGNAAPRRTDRPAPTQSLNDYLDERARGGRR